MKCRAPACASSATTRRPFCETHWEKLPGRTRSKLALSLTCYSATNAIAEQLIGRAINQLPAEAA